MVTPRRELESKGAIDGGGAKEIYMSCKRIWFKNIHTGKIAYAKMTEMIGCSDQEKIGLFSAGICIDLATRFELKRHWKQIDEQI